MNCRGAAPKGAASFFMPVELFLFMSVELLLFLAWRRLFPRLVLWSVDCCNRALRGISKGAVRSRAELSEVDCCNRALRGISKGAVRSRAELPEVDCCNGALRGISKGAVRSRAELPEVDCCNGALRGISKGSMASGTCQLRRSRYRVSVLENYRPRKKDKTTYPHQSADQVIKD